MSRQARPRDPLGLDRAREELLAGPVGTQFEWGDRRVRIGDLPLLRRTAGGGLVQALRVVIESSREFGSISVTVAEKGSVLDKATTEVTGRHRLLLFVPESDRTRALDVTISDERGEPLVATVDVQPQRKWSIFLVHHSHLDIGYTDPQSAVLRHHLAYLDSVLDLVDATDSWPAPAQFRWNVEANWPLRHWLAGRPGPVVDAFLDRVRQGRVEVTALPFSMHTEAYSMDELARQLWFADELRERHGIAIDTAMQTDVPGATVGLLHALAAADIRYLAVAHNYAGRSVPHLIDGQQLTRPFIWTNEAGEKLCVWYTDTPHGMAYMEGNLLGLAEEYDTAAELLPEYLGALAQRPYPYTSPLFGWWGLPSDVEPVKHAYPHDILHVRVQGSLADNASPSLVPAEIVQRWSSEWAYPQLRLATNREFFGAVEERLAGSLEEFRGDWTDWWADGIGSGARPLGFNRRAQGAIRSAQTLHAVADCIANEHSPVQDPWVQFDEAYDEMALFDEHTWGAANPWEDHLDKMDSGVLQWQWKVASATAASERIDRLTEAGLRRLAPLWGAPIRSLGAVVVVNPTTWERTDLATVFLPESRIDPDLSVEIVDVSTGEALPSVTEPKEHAAFRPRGRYVSFVARDVPPVGYAMYEIRRSSAGPTTAATRVDGEPFIEDDDYRVEFDPTEGRVFHIHDRERERDLVAPNAPFGFNQYIYDRYATAPHFNHLSSRVRAEDLTLLGGRSVGHEGVVIACSSSPVRERLTARISGEGVHRLETTLTLVRGAKRLDITNRLHKIGTENKESVFFAFPFGMRKPSITYEITGGTGSPAGPHIPGSAQHMRAIRHWVALESPELAIAWATLEAPLVQFGNVYLPYAPFPPTLEREDGDVATIYSWVMNNIWDTNFPARQQGEMCFRYAVAGAALGDGEFVARKTGAALANPLLALLVKSSEAPRLPERGSFCRVDRRDVEVVAITQSRRGHDLAVRIHSHLSASREVAVSFPLLRIERAWKGTHLERHLEEAAVDGDRVRLTMRPGELATLSLRVRGTADA